MSTHVVRRGDARVTTTPNAEMTTLGSPTSSSTHELSLWQVKMNADQQGPVHDFDVEQIWTVLEGRPTIVVDGDAVTLQPGDAVSVPAGTTRQISAGTAAAKFLVCGRASGRARQFIDGKPGEASNPPWMA